MKVLFAASEAAPFFKTGGLGDVTYALPKEIAKQKGIDIRVVLPFYTQMPQKFKDQVEERAHFRFQLGVKNVYCGIKQLKRDGVIYYFIDNLSYFDRGGLYGDWDDGERFAFFSTAIIEMLEVIDWIPDIIHVNDWQTAMVPVLLVDRFHWKERLRHIRKVLTIHNIRFQGIYAPNILEQVFGTGYNVFTSDGVEQNGLVNYLKGGINFSDRVTTVSPSYAQEILQPQFGEGLEGTLRHNQWKLSGIINGIDYDINNPASDPHLTYHYSKDDLTNKTANKVALQKELGLPVDESVAMIGVVSRLTDQKGFQLVESVMEQLLQAYVQVVILGTGDSHFEHAFRYFEHTYPNKMRALIKFDIGLAQRIYGGSDLFLMPSAFEPCGLSQMVAMRYGTVPIVHEVGGLRDTVEPYNQFTLQGTGFSFYDFNAQTLLATIYNALDTYYKYPENWAILQQNGMAKDFTWQQPAQDYISIYQSLIDE